jgi:peptide/nickel transport system substrate-binding protein
MIDAAGPWGTGPYRLVEGFSLPDKRSDRVVLEANPTYWDKSRFPRLKRIVFDNTLSQREAVELVMSGEGRLDLVTELSPLDTLRVARSPFAALVKNRGAFANVLGHLNMKKAGSPWRDVRLRQAVNLAINRADLIRYATNGNGVVIPALVPATEFGHDPTLAPYPFEPTRARELLRESGYPDGLSMTLIAPEDLRPQATVVGKMLEQVGFKVDLQLLDPATFNRKTLLTILDQPAESQPWDIALTFRYDTLNFPVFQLYYNLVLGGAVAWVNEAPELQRLYDEVLRTVDRDRQQALTRQMERQARDQAYLLFLYNPIQLYAVNKGVRFVPYVNTSLTLAETSVTDQHWSVRKGPTKP